MAVHPRKQPQRSCLSCRKQREKRALTRLVRTADGSVLVDERGREPGRGGYLCDSPACWEQGIEGGLLGRALRTTVTARDRATLRDYARRFAPTEAAPAESVQTGEGVR